MRYRKFLGMIFCLALFWSPGCDDGSEDNEIENDTDSGSETEALNDSSEDSDSQATGSLYRMVLQLPESFDENPVGVVPVFFTGDPGTGSGMPQAAGDGVNDPVLDGNKQILLEGQAAEITGNGLVTGRLHAKVVLYVKAIKMGATPGEDYVGYSKETLEVGDSLADFGTIEMKLAE